MSEVFLMTKKRSINSIQKENVLKDYIDLELETKGKGNPAVQKKIAEIEDMIFEDIKKMIEDYERDHQKSTKHKIIAALKNRS